MEKNRANLYGSKLAFKQENAVSIAKNKTIVLFLKLFKREKVFWGTPGSCILIIIGKIFPIEKVKPPSLLGIMK